MRTKCQFSFNTKYQVLKSYDSRSYCIDNSEFTEYLVTYSWRVHIRSAVGTRILLKSKLDLDYFYSISNIYMDIHLYITYTTEKLHETFSKSVQVQIFVKTVYSIEYK